MSFGGGGSPDIIQQPVDNSESRRLAKEAAAREAQALKKRRGAVSMIATSGQGDTSTPQAAGAQLLGG